MTNRELNDLGRKNNCDKSDKWHTFKGKTYLDVYQNYFEKYKDKTIVFLEKIGRAHV